MKNEIEETTPPIRVRTHVLLERNIQWYFGTQLFSLTGLMLRSSLLSLLLIDLVGKEKAPSLIGMVWALNVLPGAFLGVFAGLFLDRRDKRNTLIVTALFGAWTACMFAYYTRHSIHDITIWKIMAITLVTGFTNTLDGVGRNVITKDAILHPENYGIGAILFTSLYTLAMVLGNGLAGYLVVSIGYSASFLLNGFSYLILIFGLSKMRLEKKKPLPLTGVWNQVKEGARYTFVTPGIRFCIFLSATITIFGFAYQVILAIIAKTMFNGGPKEYSYLAAIGGLGSLAGSLVTVVWSEQRRRYFVVGGCLIGGISQILLARATDLHTGALLLFFCGFGFMTSFLPPRGAIMELAAKPRVGVVLGITFMFFYTGMMTSSVGAGFAATHAGCPAVLSVCGSILVGLALIIPFLSGMKVLERKAELAK